MIRIAKTLRTSMINLRDSGATDPLLQVARALLLVLALLAIVGICLTAVAGLAYIPGDRALYGPAFTGPGWTQLVSGILTVAAFSVLIAIITSLLSMIDAVGSGLAFAPASATNMKKIAWHVLGLQIVGSVANMLRTPLHDPLGLDLEVRLSTPGIAASTEGPPASVSDRQMIQFFYVVVKAKQDSFCS